MPVQDLDGRIAQGWGGSAPNGVHVNVILANRGSATAAAMTNVFATPTPGFVPILVCTGIDQASYETVNPPTILLNKSAPSSDFNETLIYGAAQVGTAQAVLDLVADGLLVADQETVVFVSLWIDSAADNETTVRHSTREAVGKALREAAQGRAPGAASGLAAAREAVRHPFYGGE